MKLHWKEVASAVLLGLVMPGVILAIAASREEPETVIEIQTEVPTHMVTIPEETTAPLMSIRLFWISTKKITNICTVIFI